MRLGCLLIFLLFLHSSLRAQDTNSTRFERIAYVTGATLTLSLVDYLAFSLNNHSASTSYRIVQGAAQAGLSYFLYHVCGLNSAIAFNLEAWTWNQDLAFYGWAYAFNPASNGRWENRSWNGLQSRGINWAGWTPVGLFRPRGSNIARSTVLAQAIVGFSISMAILW